MSGKHLLVEIWIYLTVQLMKPHFLRVKSMKLKSSLIDQCNYIVKRYYKEIIYLQSWYKDGINVYHKCNLQVL